MSFLKYDYYGNYGDDVNKFNFTVNEIHKNQKEREKKRVQIYDKILIRCLKKIKESSIKEDSYSFFEMPEYIPGMPLYNMTECLMYILNALKDKVFNSRYVDPYLIFISWNIPNANYKMIEPPPKEPVLKTINSLKYKPIENYKADNNFLFRKL